MSICPLSPLLLPVAHASSRLVIVTQPSRLVLSLENDSPPAPVEADELVEPPLIEPETELPPAVIPPDELLPPEVVV